MAPHEHETICILSGKLALTVEREEHILDDGGSTTRFEPTPRLPPAGEGRAVVLTVPKNSFSCRSKDPAVVSPGETRFASCHCIQYILHYIQQRKDQIMKATVLVSLALTAPPLFAGSPAMGNNDIVVSADVESSNGIILVIDRVMLPPGFSL